MCRVLILDDDQFAGETVKLILENSEEAVADVVTTAEEALAKATYWMQAGKPYEVFFVDQRLGFGKDGIEVFKELRSVSPDSDGIIFTGYEDTENGLRAYEAGAFRYISKPFENRELLFLLKSAKQWRKEQREQGWQRIFGTMMEEVLLQPPDFNTVAQIVVRNSLRLGFQRAHLFWVPTQRDKNKEGLLVGISCAGIGSISNFSGGLYPLRDWYSLNRSSKKYNAFFRREVKTKQARRQLKALGYSLPATEAAILPLWHATSLVGALVLDYGQAQKILAEHERSLLNLFARQVSVALEHSSIYGREQRLLQESSVIRNIGRQITTKAANVNLLSLLEEVRQQIGQLMDISNFALILFDQEIGKFSFHLRYENNKIREGRKIVSEASLEEYMLKQPNAVFIPNKVKEFAGENNLAIRGKVPSAFLGVLLRTGKQVVGGIVVKKFGKAIPFSRHEKNLLISVADQIAGAVQISWYSEADREDAERIQILQRASLELLRVARKNVDYLWRTVLTIATSNFGLGFNRALLLLLDESKKKFVCNGAIGTNDVQKASKDWKRDLKRKYTFDNFLRDLDEGKLPHTEFDKLINNIVIPIDGRQDALNNILKSGGRQIISEERSADMLPDELIRSAHVAACAILPINIGNEVKGFVLIDNKHTQKPIIEKSLDRLQALLNNAGLVYETLRERQKSNSLLDANQEIMRLSNSQPLSETLMRICSVARIIGEADWAVIYPIQPDNTTTRFDLKNVGYAGELKNPEQGWMENQPRIGGVSSHVLAKGLLIVPDVDSDTVVIGRQRLSEHHFLKSENVKAVIGVSIQDPHTTDPLGVLYLNYRQKRVFTDLMQQHAKSLASLAALAITNFRRFDELRQRRLLDIALAITETIGTSLELEPLLQKVLGKLQNIFVNTSLCILLYDEDDRSLQFAPATLQFYKIRNPQYKGQKKFDLDGKSIACKVARSALVVKSVQKENVANVRSDPDYLPLNPGTQSELCVSLMGISGDLLGVLALERSSKGFSEDDVALVETVARQISVAIERANQKENLDFKSTVAAAYAWAADIAHDINREVGFLQGMAYLIKNNPSDPAKVGEWAEKIQQSSRSLATAGIWRKPETKKIHVDAVIQGVVDNFASRANVKVDFYLGCEQVLIDVDPVAFERILRHLVRNSIQAMEKMQDRKIIVSTRVDSNMAEILFQDLGPGITPDVWSSLFQRRISTKGNEGGFGLLFTRQLVEDMGGRIRLINPPDEVGAVFSIKFPVADR